MYDKEYTHISNWDHMIHNQQTLQLQPPPVMIQFMMPYFSLYPSQALASLMFIFTPHNAQSPVTYHPTYVYRFTHPYLPSHMTLL